jgi:threonylcarbamoyladenosine tRNA methylthiotransferase CDKAL1
MTSIHFITQGCSANISDTEQMKGLLKEAKFDIVDELEEADIVILNSCVVKTPTESALITKLEQIKQEYPYKIIIVAGCMAQSDRHRLKAYSLIGTRQLHNIVEVVEESLNNNIVKMLETGEMPPLNLPKVRKNPVVEIIPISRGCLSACTFCQTRFARGRLKSYPISEIVATARKAALDGVKEIWLTSQDNMCYGFDIDTNLARLLEKLVQLPGEFKIRVGMGSPEHVMKFRDELFPLLNHEKVFKFIHLPQQSGSNRVLELMKRGNSKEEFTQLVKEFRQNVPGITVATDIIVGFPTETDEDHWETLNLIREINPDIINISKFWARSKTSAEKMEQLPMEVIKHRTKILTDIFHNISRMKNEKWIGWEGDIVINEEGEDRKQEGEISRKQWIGKNPYYKQVIVEGEYKLGDILKVKINRASTFAIIGEVIH